MATIVLRSAGTQLKNNTIDSNFTNLNVGKLDKLEAAAQTVASAITFDSSSTVSGAFTSVGIADNATSTAITIDTNESVSIGTAPTATYTGSNVWLSVGPNSFFHANPTPTGAGFLTQLQNAYFHSTSFSYKYISTGAASLMQQGVGGMYIQTSASGTTGNTITFNDALRITDSSMVLSTGGTAAMTINSSQNIAIGTGSALTNGRVQITETSAGGNGTALVIHNDDSTAATRATMRFAPTAVLSSL